MKIPPIVRLHQPNLDKIWAAYMQQGYQSHATWGMTKSQLMQVILFIQEQHSLEEAEQPDGTDFVLTEYAELLSIAGCHLDEVLLDADQIQTGKDVREAITTKLKVLDGYSTKLRESGVATKLESFEITVRRLDSDEQLAEGYDDEAV
jgi:hypothetical protein